MKKMNTRTPKSCRNVSVVVIRRVFLLSFFVVMLCVDIIFLTFLFDVSVCTGNIGIVVCNGFNGYLWFVGDRMRGFIGIQYREDLTGSFICHFVLVMKFSCILISYDFYFFRKCL